MAGDLIPLYYITGTAGAIVAVMSGARSYYARQKKRWTDEGARSVRMTEAIESNTKAAEQNTAKLGELGDKLQVFAEETRSQFRVHDTRINRLEDLADGGFPTRQRRLRGNPGDN